MVIEAESRNRKYSNLFYRNFELWRWVAKMEPKSLIATYDANIFRYIFEYKLCVAAK